MAQIVTSNTTCARMNASLQQPRIHVPTTGRVPAKAVTPLRQARQLGGQRLVGAVTVRRSSSGRVGVSVTAEANSGKPRHRVVVTGLGVVSPLGHHADEFYDNLLEGKSGISLIENCDMGEIPTKFAGEIKELDCKGYITPKNVRRLDPYIKYTMVAAKKALEYAGIGLDSEEMNSLDKTRCGSIIGSAMGGFQTFATAVEVLNEKGPRKMNPFCIPFAITNMSSALLAMDLGFMGPNYSCSSACASGNHCIMNAMQHVQRGDADLMLAGASDASVIPIGMAGFSASKALSKRNDSPQTASRPWDKNRDGFVMGEGAGVLVLESLEHAQARGAQIYAEILGGSYTCDAHHMTEPNPTGKGVAMCIERALADAGVEGDQVNYVNAHATSTPAGDLAEYRAINLALSGNGTKPVNFKMNSTKSLIGHLLGAAGAVEAVCCVKAITTGFIHPNLNIETPEEEVNLDLIVGAEKEEMEIKVAISNSFGFGGHNSCIVFAPFVEA